MRGRIDPALAAATGFALIVPVVLLLPWGSAPLPPPRQAVAPLTVGSTPPLTQAYDRLLFAAAPGAVNESVPADAPALLGIVGRLGEDAVALVKTADGTRALKIGDSVDGWSLASLAIDAAYFARGTERVRVALPVE